MYFFCFEFQARKLAETHAKESVNIERTTNIAFNTSSKAFEIASEARRKEETTNKDLKDMLFEGDQASMLAKESRMLIKQAENTSNSALAESKELLEDGKKPLPELNAQLTKGSH